MFELVRGPHEAVVEVVGRNKDRVLFESRETQELTSQILIDKYFNHYSSQTQELLEEKNY